MAFQLPEGLHPDLNPLAWIVGTWRGKGQGEYPGIEPFTFFHEVTFNHDGRAFLNYYSRSWISNEKNEIVKPGDDEVGYWFLKDGKIINALLSHSLGVTEGWVGVLDGPRIQLAMDQGYSLPNAPIVTGGSRLYGLVEGELFFAYDMAANGKTLQAHIWSTMERQN